MLTLFLIRHGETDTVGRSLMGWIPGCHLNPTGTAQAEKLAEKLSTYPITAIYTSPLERAVETAAPIASRKKLQLQRSNHLGEWRPGVWEGEAITELDRLEEWRRFNAFRGGVRPAGGETMIEVQARMLRQIECLQQQHDGQIVAAVSHAEPIRAVLAHYAGIPLDLTPRLEISPASVSVIRVDDWAPKLLCVNGTGDLAV